MKLKQLQALRAVAETGSLQGAAGRLCVTQPAVSRAIIDLESELGVPLLTRTARGALLTGFGASILKRALLIDREVGRIYDAADAERRRRRLCIAITPVSATEAFLDAVTAFAAERPDVRLSILELRRAQIVAGLQDGSLDIACIRNTACWRTPRRTTGWNRCMRSARRWLSAADMRVRWMSAPKTCRRSAGWCWTRPAMNQA